jgi:hypothetical protein
MKSEEALELLKDYKNKSNKELTDLLDFLQEDFEKTKDLLVKLTYHLDTTEKSYNKILEEYKKRSTHNG